ncbi:triose-phosphate isomerase [Candidatus Beckwithbacteria bacterium]|nr:triose-phosphate isomerase [Candidatus Beckwithbacteria bacterium]
MIVVNLKTYQEITQRNRGVALAQSAQEVFKRYQIPIMLCVQATDIKKTTEATFLPVFAQHIDPIEPGKHTGFISPLSVKENGATGTLINHSEHRIGLENIEKTIRIAKQYNLQTLVCVENAQEGKQVAKFEPDMIALEDPVLIGGSESIVNNPEGKAKVEEFIKLRLKPKCLVGAGVKDQNDIRVSLQLKAAGVLLASGVALADNPKAVLEDLSQGFK